MRGIVKVLGGGLGMASEAIHDYRARSKSPAAKSPPPSYTASSSSSPFRDITSPDHNAPREADYLGYRNEYKLTASEVTFQDEWSSSEDDGDDEAAWELDEMAEHVAANSPAEPKDIAAAVNVAESDQSETISKKENNMIRDLVLMAGPPPQPAQRLPYPVIIPQRRPGNKSRGFVRAYAPVMEGCGVRQDVFLRFQDDWVKASKSDPWIDIVFVAAGIAGFAPSAAAKIVTAVVQVVAGTAREVQSRHRRNTFLDRANQELFMPRGMYAMVMAFKEETSGQQLGGPLNKLASALGKSLFSTERLDIHQTAAKYSNPDPGMSKWKKGFRDMRVASGKTYTQVELPEAASLIYPDLDRVMEYDRGIHQDGEQSRAEKTGLKDKLKGAGAWVQDYRDRKAQATFERDHQGSSLAVPSSSRAGFSSRFNDPDHPANSGSLISLVTGGAIKTDPRQARGPLGLGGRNLNWDIQDQRRLPIRGGAPREAKRGLRGQTGQRKSVIKKMLQQDVLYLLIVNLPTEQEVQKSVAELERMMGTGA